MTEFEKAYRKLRKLGTVRLYEHYGSRAYPEFSESNPGWGCVVVRQGQAYGTVCKTQLEAILELFEYVQNQKWLQLTT